MLDRASTFADREIVDLLKTRFIPVALDQAYQRRQQDAEGEFYRKIAGQGPRDDFNGTTQGLYIATPSGNLLMYNNNRDPAKVRALMKRKLAEFKASAESSSPIAAIEPGKADARFNPAPPEGGLIVRVQAKVLGGYEPTTDPWRTIFQTALSRDNLWITQSEHEALVRGELPRALQRRIARFHLVDNTRGEPPMWREAEIREFEMTLENGRLRGHVHLETDRGDRGFEAELLGFIESHEGKVIRFDLVVLGEFWGEGRFTGRAPKGKFPLAVAFKLAGGSDVADQVPPQGARGWLEGYLR